jgi:serine phosphatase RsbU (regulator of sigma subunit)/anti-sigma regulatory factor (Ser/Thr protein kinase)/transposase/TolA-binding protein
MTMFKRVIKEEYKIPANVNYLGEMRDFVTRVGRKYGVSEQIINAFKLAIDEAGTNIIRHAYRDWEGFITIRIIIRDNTVTVSLVDQGHAFDPRNVRDPDLQRYVDIGKKGGLGIFIIRRVIDDILYRKTEEGNELKLTKNRVVRPQKRFFMPDVNLTMKSRFSFIASGVITAVALIVFLVVYTRQGWLIRRQNFEAGRNIARSIASQSSSQLATDNHLELMKIVSDAHVENAPLMRDAFVVDSANYVLGTLDGARLAREYHIPTEKKRVKDSIFEYRMNNENVVYHIVQSVYPEISGIADPIGTVHLILDKKTINKQIIASRSRIFGIFVLIVVVGNLGIFILIYLMMSPFKKLASWVRELGRGETQGEVEFDSDDEIGEIAKAFNEITEKFRKSQENLAEQERLQKEMQVAQEIQQILLPSEFPEIDGFEIASYYEAAKEVGGDYFDFVEVDKDTLGIVVADVSGKGVPGSLVMTMIRTALRTEARGNKNAADVLARVNDFVINDIKRGMFVTIFYLILDSKNRIINYASAGHNPMILYRLSTKKSFYLNPRGFPIGINLPDKDLFKNSIESDTLRLKEGDVLIIYTDGITEAMNPNRERFGDERFLSTIRQYGLRKVDPLVDKIRDEITLFTEGHAQSDDITLVAVKEKLKAEDVLFNLRSKLLTMVNEEKLSVKKACQVVGVSTSTYYKYKKRFDEMGEEGLKEKVQRSEFEEKHISIEDKAKIFDIIKEHSEFGAKRIQAELHTEKYGFTQLDDKRIYEELVRTRLNTKELRIAFIAKGGQGKRMKPPGTPLLTLDGKVIVERRIQPSPVRIKPQHEGHGEADPEKIPPPIERRVSQSPQEVIENMAGEGDDSSTLLEDFLDFSNMSQNTAELSEDMDHSFEQDETQNVSSHSDEDEEAEFSFSDPEDFSETEDSSSGSDTFTSPIEEETDEEKDHIELETDDIFNDWIVDVTNEDRSESPDASGAGKVSLDEILKVNGDGLDKKDGGDQIEDRITNSIASELLDEEIGIDENGDRKKDTEDIQEEGFIEMMEGLGFDRRTMFSDVKTGRTKEPEDPKRALNRKRFLESGLWFYRQGLYSKAMDEFKKVLDEDPNCVEACQYMGDTFFRLGQLDKARDAYERVRQFDPNNTDVMENLGVIFANQGDYKKAVWQWGEVLKRNPERKDIITRIKKMQRVIRQRYL